MCSKAYNAFGRFWNLCFCDRPSRAAQPSKRLRGGRPAAAASQHCSGEHTDALAPAGLLRAFRMTAFAPEGSRFDMVCDFAFVAKDDPALG